MINFYPDLTEELLLFIKGYYETFLSLSITSLEDTEIDNELLKLLQKKPSYKNDCPNCLDIFAELFLAYGSEAKRIAPKFFSGFSFQESRGFLDILKKLGNSYLLGEETGYLYLGASLEEMIWPGTDSENSRNSIHIWVDSVDGSKRMEEVLKKKEEVSRLEKAISALLKEKAEYKLITNSPSTGITIVNDGKIIFSIGLNLFTGEAIGSYYNGLSLIPFYIPNVVDFSDISSLQTPIFAQSEGIILLCYRGNKGYNKDVYQENLEQSMLSRLQMANAYTTGPLRIAYLIEREEIKKLEIQIAGSNREKLHDVGNLLALGLSSPELIVYVAADKENQGKSLILKNGQLDILAITLLSDPRHAKTTFCVFHKQNKEAQDFFNRLYNQGKGYFLK